MALTPSSMLELGTPAPDFSLPDTNGKIVSLKDFKHHQGLIVAFWCNHCPYVHHIRAKFLSLSKEWSSQNIRIVAINANDAKRYQTDSPAAMKEEAQNQRYCFPYLYDETQAVAKAYHAECTPDLYLFNEARNLVYRGRFCASTPGNALPVTGEDLQKAVKAMLNGTNISNDQRPSFGCSIKWK